jgi:hypothetical protein
MRTRDRRQQRDSVGSAATARSTCAGWRCCACARTPGCRWTTSACCWMPTRPSGRKLVRARITQLDADIARLQRARDYLATAPVVAGLALSVLHLHGSTRLTRVLQRRLGALLRHGRPVQLYRGDGTFTALGWSHRGRASRLVLVQDDSVVPDGDPVSEVG